MTGWRIGIHSCTTLDCQSMQQTQGQYTSGASSIAPKAATAAFAGDQSCVEERCVKLSRRRDLIIKLCKEIPNIEINVPDGAFYVFLK